LNPVVSEPEIAGLFKGIGLRKGEESPELRGFAIKNAFEE
jgi:hypothetical protein